MVSFSNTKYPSIIIVGSILASLWALQIGSADALEVGGQQGGDDAPIVYDNVEGWDYFEGENENEYDYDSVHRRTKRIKKRRQGNKGGGKGGSKGKKGKKVTETEDRTVFDLRLEECLKSVLDETSRSRSNSTTIATETRAPETWVPSSETRSPRSDIPESDDEEMLFIRRLAEGPDEFLNSREGSTCDIEITEAMQEMVSEI